MSKRLNLADPSRTERMRRTVVEVAQRAVETRQLDFTDAAIGALYAAFDCHCYSGLSAQGAIAVMRKSVDAMAKALEDERRAPLLDMGPGSSKN